MKGEIQMMEYAKEEVLTVGYPMKKDKLETGIPERIYNKIKRNKVVALFLAMGITFMVLDLTFLYYFCTLLTKL